MVPRRSSVHPWKPRLPWWIDGGTALAPSGPVQTPGKRTQSRLARRRGVRRLSGGFTLIELMVVVVMVSVLAVLAIPAMSRARDDRVAFDHARRIQQLSQRERARAAGSGGAHLIIAGPKATQTGTNRGKLILYEALDNVDGTIDPTLAPGPNPTSSCRGVPTGVAQWSVAVTAWPANAAVPPASNLQRAIDLVDADTAGINVDADIRITYAITEVGAPTVLIPKDALAICVTGNGTTYAAGASTVALAVAAMQASSPFTGVIRISVTRGGGLTRNILIGGAGAARIYSQ